MNYLDWLLPKLKNLPEQRVALTEIQESIETLEMSCEMLQASGVEGARIPKRPSKVEEAYLDNLCEWEQLQKNLEITRREVAQMERVLALLSDEERLVLERFYINRQRDHLRQLCKELDCKEAQVYEIKSRATIKLSRMLFGQVDS